MDPQTPNSGQAQNQSVKVNNPLSVMQSGERNLFEVRRHPIGMLGTYITLSFLLVIAAVLAFIVAPDVLTSVDHAQVNEIGSLAFVVIAFFVVLIAFVAHKVYWGNCWILTSDSLTQVLQRSLFDKQSSQLSLGNLEDVTVQQDGIFAHMFNYGVLRVETAGERSKFVFPLCPNPNVYAQQVLQAREQFEQNRRDEQRPYRGEGSYQNSYNNMQPPPGPQQPPAGPGQGQSQPYTPPQDDDSGVNINTEA